MIKPRSLGPKTDSGTTLRDQILRGGALLVVREGASVGLGLVGLVILTRLIGSANYGVYAGALAIVLFLGNVGIIGVRVQIIRHQESVDSVLLAQARGLLVVSSAVVTAIGMGVVPLFAEQTGGSGAIGPALVMTASLPVTILALPARASLERDLRYGAVALLDLSSQVCFYAVALPWADVRPGIWPPVVGYFASQAILFVLSAVASLEWPTVSWSRPVAGQLMRSGLAYSSSVWMMEGRRLINPLVVGPLLGASAVGQVALAMRIVDTLTTVSKAMWQLSLAAFAKLRDDTASLERAISEGMLVQIMIAGPALAVFSAVAPFVVPLLFGRGWHDTLLLLPFIATGNLIRLTFNMPMSALVLKERYYRLFAIFALQLGLFIVGALGGVLAAGLVGYGAAELAALFGYILLAKEVALYYLVEYWPVVPLLAALLPALFASLVPPPYSFALLSIPTVALLHPRYRRPLAEYASHAIGAIRRRRPVDSVSS